jgi:hypothetical protein
MLRSAASKVMWVGRATVFLVGLAVILAVVLGLASMALAANGDAWRLGRTNVATAITVLGGAAGVDGPMVRLTNNNGGTNDTALSLGVQSGEPPMKVNSTTKVTNLNADRVDGKDADELRGISGLEIVSDESENTTGQLALQRVSVSCPDGKRLLGGGAEIEGDAFNDFDGNIALIESRPFTSGWVATADDMDEPDSTTADSYTLLVYAICATAR